MPPLPADSIHARACKLKCEKILTRPLKGGTRQVVKAEIRLWYFCGQTRKRRSFHCGVFYE